MKAGNRDTVTKLGALASRVNDDVRPAGDPDRRNKRPAGNRFTLAPRATT